MFEYLFKKPIDKSLLDEGVTIPLEIMDDFINLIAPCLQQGDERPLTIWVNYNKYVVDLRYLKFKKDVYSDRKVLQIRYNRANPIREKLSRIFYYTESHIRYARQNNEKFKSDEYIKLYAKEIGVLEFECYPQKGVSMEYIIELFKNWMAQNASHKFNESTIKQYAKALENADKWLDIILDTPIFSIKDEKLFKETEEKIRNVANFDEVNKKHSNGVLSAGLTLYGKFLTEMHYLLQKSEITVKDDIENIKKYIASKGFTYEDKLIENFYLSLKSKPFVILAGTSGTGKTKLVKLFAESIGANMKLVPVRPDWSDSTDLFGHTNLSGKFIPGAIIDYIKEAGEDPGTPYFLCLDEMNLARVEYYLSDFLSIMETREFEHKEIITEPIITEDKYGADTEAVEKYGNLRLPENLYIIGTVNMDETTFPFSKKVLDRANTIEFSEVNLIPDNSNFNKEVVLLPQTNDLLKTEYLILAHCEQDADFVNEICMELQKINEILRPANAHIGYRVRDEIVFYMVNNKHSNLLSKDEAMDFEIMQKILPRIQGGSSTIKEMLCDLFMKCAADFQGRQTESSNIAEEMFKVINRNNCRYKRSAEKIAFMVRRYEEDGFTSYWL